MPFRWLFQLKPQSGVTDEAALRIARAELSRAETELEQARSAYLRLQQERQSAKLRLQQPVFDQALLRYHAARQAVRQLEQPAFGPVPWQGAQRRRGTIDGVPSKS